MSAFAKPLWSLLILVAITGCSAVLLSAWARLLYEAVRFGWEVAG